MSKYSWSERSYNGCKDKTDEEILLLNRSHRRYNRKKKRDIGLHCKDSNPIFKIVLLDIYDKKEREADLNIADEILSL